MTFIVHPWKIIQKGLDLHDIRLSESLMSVGNGYMGMRGNFEEDFSGDTHIGTYIGGVWFPIKRASAGGKTAIRLTLAR